VPNAAFAEIRVSRRAAGGNYECGEPLAEQVVSVIEASAVNGRGTAVILGGPENNNCVGAMQFLLVRVVDYGVCQESKNSGESS
jgi:hypothetical protein